jgi:hypothetical protein
MTTIETHFLGPTDRRGSRYMARALGTNHRIIIGADDRLDYRENHRLAALALAERQGWTGRWLMGDAGPRGYVWVNDWPSVESFEVTR